VPRNDASERLGRFLNLPDIFRAFTDTQWPTRVLHVSFARRVVIIIDPGRLQGPVGGERPGVNGVVSSHTLSHLVPLSLASIALDCLSVSCPLRLRPDM